MSETPEKEEKQKRTVWQTVWLVLSRVFLTFSILIMAFSVFSSLTFNKDKEVFGVKMYVILSDSMSATDFSAGDLIFVQSVDPDSLEAGDIITFISQNKGSYGETVTHKIREKTVTESGAPAFITYGTTTGVNDGVPVTYQWIQGKYVGKLPFVGSFFTFLKTAPGYIIFLLLPFLLLIGWQLRNCIRAYKEYKGEKTDALREERENLRREREANQKLLEEMRLAQEQLARQQAAAQGTESAQTDESSDDEV